MTSKETIAYLNDLRIKNNVSFSEIEETIAQNENQILKITECLEKDDNYSKEVMGYVFKLLNNNFEEVLSYYYQSCIDSVKTFNNGKQNKPKVDGFGVAAAIGTALAAGVGVAAAIGTALTAGVAPTGEAVASGTGIRNLRSQKVETFWEDEHSAIVFIISSFFHNPVFFTKAWNLNAIINWKISKKKNQEDELDDFYIPMVASSADKGFLYKEIPDIGTMYMYYDEDYEELTLRIEVNEENLNKNFKVRQKIQYAETGDISEIRIEANGQKTIQKATKPKGNPSLGIRYLGKPKIELAEQSKNHINNKNILLFKDFQDIRKSISIDIDYDIIVAAASESGFNNITKIPVDLLGEIEILGNRETKRLLFTLFLNPEAYNLKFELIIGFEVQDVYKTAVLKKDSETESKEVNSLPIHIDFTNGFKLKKITWNYL